MCWIRGLSKGLPHSIRIIPMTDMKIGESTVGNLKGRQGPLTAAEALSALPLLARMNELERFLYDPASCGKTFHMDLLSEMERNVFGRIPAGLLSVELRLTWLEEEIGPRSILLRRAERLAEERGGCG